MADDKKEKWMNWLALTTVIFAVCATLSTFKGGGFSTKTILAQSQESDTWAYFQSKSIKSYLYEVQKEKLELELKTLPDNPDKKQTAIEDYQKKIKSYEERIARYDGEKNELQRKAEGLKAEKTSHQKHSQAFGMAVIFLQIAILLCSIAGLMKKKPVWLLGSLIGVWGIVNFLNGFWLFF